MKEDIMKKLHILGLAISTVLCAPMAAQASDGTITFTGALTAQTCLVNGGPGKDFIVTLPTVSTGILKVAGNTAGATNFSIDVTECSSFVQGYTAYFEANPNVNLTSGNLKNTDLTGAGSVEIQLLNAASTTPINLSKPTELQGVTTATVANSAGTSNFIARYYATGATTAGLVASQITYSLVYN